MQAIVRSSWASPPGKLEETAILVAQGVGEDAGIEHFLSEYAAAAGSVDEVREHAHRWRELSGERWSPANEARIRELVAAAAD
jgi:hypothetical protein